MGKEGYYSELKLEGRITEAEPTADNQDKVVQELQLEHKRDDILFWVIVTIALFLAACVAGGVFCFFHFFH